MSKIYYHYYYYTVQIYNCVHHHKGVHILRYILFKNSFDFFFQIREFRQNSPNGVFEKNSIFQNFYVS